MSAPTRLKLLVVAPDFNLGGAQRIAITLAEAWAREGHDVTMAVFNRGEGHYDTRIPVVTLDAPARAGFVRKALTLLARAERLTALMRRDRPDRVFSFMESANFPATLACARAGNLGDLTVSVRDNPASFPWLFRRSLPFVYRWPGRIVAISEGTAQALKAMALPAERLVTIPNPLDSDAVASGAQAPLPPEVAEGGPYVLAVGRLAPQKGFDMLLDAFAALAPHTTARLVILGEGAERPRLEAQIRDLALVGRVDLPGKVANPFNYMARAECLVLSSRHEGWGNVLAEAMGAGCPVVAFDCPYGPRELIGEAGLLVPAGDVPGLTAALRRLLDDASLRERLAEAGARRSRQFNLPAIAGRWLVPLAAERSMR
jgi:glycosyltransferase involved in cell wall biosynthesis